MRPDPQRRTVKTAEGYEDRYYVHPTLGHMLPGVTTVLDRLPKGASFKSWERSRITRRAINNARDLPDMLRSEGVRAVEQWLADAPDEARDAAADRGTAVHNAVEALLVGDEVPDMSHKTVAPYWRSAQKFLDEVQPEVLTCDGAPMIETAMYGAFFAGSADAWLKIDGEVLLCDWKTSSGVRSNYALQLAAYLNADEFSVLAKNDDGRWRWSHEHKLPAHDGAAVVRFSTSGWELHRVTNIPDCYEAFCDAYRIWEATVREEPLFRMTAFGD